MAIDDALLTEFADTFLGYGNPAAPYWFVGMEEGGGDTAAEIALRLSVWERRGKRAFEDLAPYSRAVGVGQWFGERPKLQSTWSKLVRLLLSAEGRGCSTEDVRSFQRDELGRPDGDTALTELLPLPSPSTSDWIYGEHSGLGHLASREAYRAHYAERRADRIGRLIREHRPPLVVFYGKSYLPWWERVAGRAFRQDDGCGALRADAEGTTYLAMPHPVAMGVSNADFERAGRSIAEGPGRV